MRQHRLVYTIISVILLVIGSFGIGRSQTRVTLGPGVVGFGQEPAGAGSQFFVDEGNASYSIRISREMQSFGSLELSYTVVPSKVRTAFRTEDPDGRLVLSNFFASSDLRAHLLHVNFTRSIIEDNQSGRSFSLATGVGLIAFDPGTNDPLAVPGNIDPPTEIPTELDNTLDFSYSFGAILRFPFTSQFAVRGEIWDVLQSCEGGNADSDSYMCIRDKTIHHVHGTVGLEVSL